MSVSKTVNYPQVENGYRLLESNINFLKKPYREGMAFVDEFKAPTSVNIRAYSDFNELKKFSYFENGFEYCQLEKTSSLFQAIQNYAQARLNNRSPTEEESQLTFEIEQDALAWAKENGVSGTPVVINSAYRDSSRANGGAAPFYLVHVDYCKENIKSPYSVGGATYKEGLEDRKFGKMTNDEYKNIVHHEQMNVWILLNSEESTNGFTVFDTKSIDPADRRSIYIHDSLSGSLYANPEQVLVTKHKQTLSDRLILRFRSTDTPHSAANFEGISKSARRSIEFRIDFIEKS